MKILNKRRRGLFGKTVALAAEGRRFELFKYCEKLALYDCYSVEFKIILS